MWQRFLDRFFRRPVDAAPCVQPEVHEPLSRPEGHARALAAWAESPTCEAWMERIRCAYNVFLAGMDPQDDCIDFLEFRATAGFALHIQNESLQPGEAGFLMDHLRDRVRALPYRLSVSDRRIRGADMVERHYLKPPLQVTAPGETVDQRYGNITIEVQYRGGEPVHLRFMATHYQDRQYSQPLEFGDLVRILF